LASADSEAFAGIRLGDVVGQMPDAVIVADAPSGRILFTNRHSGIAARRPRGAAVADLAERWEIFHPDGRPYAAEEWPLARAVARGETVVDEEFWLLAGDGTRRTFICSSRPLHDARGTLIAAISVTRDVTEQRRSGRRLGLYAGLVDNTDDAVIALDEQYVVTGWNKGAERMFGWTAEEVMGRPADEIARTDLSRRQVEELRRTLAVDGRWRGDLVVRHRGGTAVDVDLLSVAVRGEGGAITGYLSVHRDITERKRAEGRLRDSHHQLETVLESITDAFVAVDAQWRYTYVNERALRRMQMRRGEPIMREDVIGSSMWEQFPDVVGTEIHERYHEAMRERRPVEFETYFAGSGEWIEAHAYPTDTGLAIYYRDVSERHAAEADRETRARQQALVAELGLQALAGDDLQALLDEAVELVARTLDVELTGVAELTAEGEMTFRAGVGWHAGVLGRIERLAGDSSLMGYTLLHREPVIVEDMAAERRFRVGPIARDHGVVSGLSVMIATPDGPFGTFPALSTRPRTFSPSDVSFVQAVANVVASAVERNRAEQRLRDATEGERRRIARDLHDEALQELTDAVVQADRGRSEGLDPAASERLGETLRRVSRRLRGAIYDLRSEDVRSRPFDEALEALVSVQRAMAVDCQVELDVGEGIPAGALGERGTEVLRIVGEALTNARRHSGARNVRVTVRASEGGLCVEVADDGRGFDVASAPPGIDATGLDGMRERAALLDGRLDVRSAPGAGTQVRLVLDHRAGERSERARILLVDDHTAVRQAIAAMFDREPGLVVVGQAASLAEARTVLAAAGVDVAVLDLGLPDGFGGDLIADLRRSNPQAQALVLTSSLDPADLSRALESGADATLDKTTELDALVDAVRRLRAVSGASRPPARAGG
jgi:PAS domain S-box-containing protein